MNTTKYNDIATTVSDLKKSPKKVIDKVKEQDHGTYIIINNKPEAVVVSVSVYEGLMNKLDSYEDKLLELEVGKRLAHEKRILKSDLEVRGVISNDTPVIDEDDGWE